MSRALRLSRKPILECLESRVLLSFDPSASEQALFDMINRMRTNPGPELDLLLNAQNPSIITAMQQFKVNATILRSQWAALTAVPPVAWNEPLYLAAKTHTQTMIKYDQQSHDVTDANGKAVEPDLRGRASEQGYTDRSYLGENVYAYADSVLHAHAAFAIDWGETPTGIQDPPGHRDTMMDSDKEVFGPTVTPHISHYREVGIAVIHPPKRPGDNHVGPLVVTEDFGGPLEPGNPFIVGSVINDLNHNGFYDEGEGLGGIRIHVAGTGGVFDTYTMTAGGYQLRLPPGTYTVTAGSGLAAPLSRSIVVGADNILANFIGAPVPDTARPSAAVSKAPKVTKAGAKYYTFAITYTDNRLVNAATINAGDLIVYGPRKFKQTASVVSLNPSSSAPSIRVLYRIVAPGGKWNGLDNGKYSLYLAPRQVRDNSGNAAAKLVIGKFLVQIGKTRSKASSAQASEPLPDSPAAPVAQAPRIVDPTGVFNRSRRIADVLAL